MNKRILIVLIGIVALLLAMGVIAALLLSKKSASTVQTNPFGQPGLNGGQAQPGQASATISIKTTTGNVLTVPNFTQGHPVATEPNGSYYYVTESAEGNDMASDYSIVYGTDSSVSIGLLAEPIGEARRHAEAQLRKLIPVTDQELCSLYITVMVAPDVNEDYSATNLGLSFCPGAVKLPQ